MIAPKSVPGSVAIGNSGVLPGLGSEPQRQRREIRGGVLGLNAAETDSGHVFA